MEELRLKLMVYDRGYIGIENVVPVMKDLATQKSSGNAVVTLATEPNSWL